MANKPTYEKDHKPFLSGVKGGFSCANCKYLDAATRSCENEHYQKWRGSSALPDGDLHEMCSDWFERRAKTKTLGEQVKEQRARK